MIGRLVRVSVRHHPTWIGVIVAIGGATGGYYVKDHHGPMAWGPYCDDELELLS